MAGLVEGRVAGGPIPRASVARVVAPDGSAVIAVGGEVDMANVECVRSKVAAAIGPEAVIFDLAELQFIDSSGIALLVQVANRKGSVSLLHVSPLIRRIIELTGLSEILAVVT